MKTTKHNSLVTAAVFALVLSFGAVAYAEKGAETLVRLTDRLPSGENRPEMPDLYARLLQKEIIPNLGSQ